MSHFLDHPVVEVPPLGLFTRALSRIRPDYNCIELAKGSPGPGLSSKVGADPWIEGYVIKDESIAILVLQVNPI